MNVPTVCLTPARCLLLTEIHFTCITLIELGTILRQWFLSFSIHQTHLEHLLNTRCYTTPLIRPPPRPPHFLLLQLQIQEICEVGAGRGARICVSNKFPDDVDPADLGTTLGEPLL